MAELYIGLMSGTSLDGIDGVLVDFTPSASKPLDVLAHVHRAFAPPLAAELLALNKSGADELHRAALAGNALARGYAAVVATLLNDVGVASQRVRAVGVHGQTVRHCPGEFDGTGYTLQLNSPALLAELAGIDVVADFRSRDVAAGGQGAPLAPAFHRAVFGRAGESVAVLNIGGISNLTALRSDGTLIGFDCGPGNALMDHWCRRHTGRPYDDGGAWAETGTVIAPLLAAMRTDPYFSAAAPKSTGRDRFHPAWLDAHLQAFASHATLEPEDVQATLAELTVSVSADDVLAYASDADELLVCGGGAFNRHLMARLAVRLPALQVAGTDVRGLPPTQVEACAFAWLARAFCVGQTVDLCAVTGAAGARVLGALYPSGTVPQA